MKKKILIHSLVFSPDGVSTAYLYNDIALKFKESGYEVTVLTTTPHYNRVDSDLQKQPLVRKYFGIYYESNYKGIRVKHVWQKKYKSTGLRLVGFFCWHVVTFMLALNEKKVDYILSPSPPLTIGWLNILLKRLKRARVIYNVQEIYPDLLIEEGGLTSAPVIAVLKKMEKWVYNHSDRVVTIGPVFYETIAPRFKDVTKLSVIPNFVDTDIYKPLPPRQLEIDRALFPDTPSLKLMYAGNIGHAQDWKPLVDLAEKLKSHAVDFFVVGEGVAKSFLEQAKVKKELHRLHLIPYQPRALMPHLIAYADMHFIFMSPHTAGLGFPSKVYTLMACAKPLLICSGANTPIVSFLKDKACAFIFDDGEDVAGRMAALLQDCSPETLRAKGRNGYEVIADTYSKEVVTAQYVKLVEELQ